MAIVITRSLQVVSVNPTQIAVQIILDTNYVETIRNIVWACYDTDGICVEEYSDTIPIGEDVISYIFSNLTPDTSYYLTATISNVQGVNGEILYKVTQNTAISGGIDHGNIPNIREFTAEQTEVGERKISYHIRVTNLVSGSCWVTIKFYLNGVLIYEREWNPTDGSLHNTFTLSKDTGSMHGNELSFGTYEVQLEAFNRGATPQRQTIFVTLVEQPNCTLNCIFEDRVHSYDNGRVTGVIYNFPKILASDWNQFCEDINIVRKKVALPTYGLFSNAISGEPMTAEMFNHLYYAILAIYTDSGLGATKPDGLVGVQQYQKITPEIINGLEIGLQNACELAFN